MRSCVSAHLHVCPSEIQPQSVDSFSLFQKRRESDRLARAQSAHRRSSRVRAGPFHLQTGQVDVRVRLAGSITPLTLQEIILL